MYYTNSYQSIVVSSPAYLMWCMYYSFKEANAPPSTSGKKTRSTNKIILAQIDQSVRSTNRKTASNDYLNLKQGEVS